MALNKLPFLLLPLLALTPAAEAHFRLLEPASWIEENNLGDPQKAGPCGGVSADPQRNTPANPGKPTNAVTRISGGQKLKIKVQETVMHPGYYRVALSVNGRDDLPKDPEVITKKTERGDWSVSGKIVYPPAAPVIADGLFQHTGGRPGMEWEAEIEVPNINCAKCTLQIIQFMADHGLNRDGDYSYHHCADLNIRADPYKPFDTRWPAEKK